MRYGIVTGHGTDSVLTEHENSDGVGTGHGQERCCDQRWEVEVEW